MKKIEEEKSFVKETETTRDYVKQQERERERETYRVLVPKSKTFN